MWRACGPRGTWQTCRATKRSPRLPSSAGASKSDTISCRTTCIGSSPSVACSGTQTGSGFAVWGRQQDDEAKLIQDFFRTVDRYKPQIVSWNGGGFDLPVLNYRAMIHGVRCPRYWETGDNDREFRYNNYLNRYHGRHLDLMDLLAMFTGRANAPLDEMARLCGFPGKLGMDGSKVWQAWRDGQIASIRDYCETDVANTWLLYCRFQLINGRLSQEEYQGEISLFRETIAGLQGAHWAEYLAAWPG